MDLEWKDPTPQGANRRRRGKCLRFIEETKKRPGVWAVYDKEMRPGVSVSNYKRLYPGTEWESRVNSTEDRTRTFYARWVGINNEHKEK